MLTASLPGRGQISKPQHALSLEAEATPQLILWEHFNFVAWRALDLPGLGCEFRQLWYPMYCVWGQAEGCDLIKAASEAW